MTDTETYWGAWLTPRDYERIEKSVVDMFSELNVKEVPINPFEIANKSGYIVLPYSQIIRRAKKIFTENGISGAKGKTSHGRYKIFYDDSDSVVRQRFTIMHEIGHIRLGHKEDSEYAEKCANYFATYSLAPTPLIYKFGCEDFMEIAFTFNISEESAIYTFARYTRWLDHFLFFSTYESKLIETFE